MLILILEIPVCEKKFSLLEGLFWVVWRFFVFMEGISKNGPIPTPLEWATLILLGKNLNKWLLFWGLCCFGIFVVDFWWDCGFLSNAVSSMGVTYVAVGFLGGALVVNGVEVVRVDAAVVSADFWVAGESFSSVVVPTHGIPVGVFDR